MTASIDSVEDPADAYRLKRPAGRRIRVTSMPSRGDPDLYLLGERARSVLDNRAVLARSRRPGLRKDTVTFTNRLRRSAVIHAVARHSRRKEPPTLDASYLLEVRGG